MQEFVYLKRLSSAERHNQPRVRNLFHPNLLKIGSFICIAVVSVTGMAWAQAGQLGG